MCEQLGLRLYNEQNTTTNTNNSATNNAILCYICSGNIQRTVDLWSQELRVSARDPSTGNLNSDLLQNYIEKVTIFTSINNNPPTSTTNTTNTNSLSNINLPIECSEYFTQYAMLIAAQGQYDLALSFLKGNSIGESILIDRLYHAATTSKTGGGVGRKVPVFPFERVNVNAIQGLNTTTTTTATTTAAASVKPVIAATTATTGVQQGGVQRSGGFTPQQPLVQPAVATTPAAQVLAPGWAQSTDPASGRVYYFNQATGQSQWEAPLVAAASAPVPQPIPQPVQQQQQQQQPNMYHRHPTVGPGINTDPAFAQPQPAFAQPYSPQSQIQQQQPSLGYPSQQPQQQQPQYQQQQAYQPIQQQQPQQPRIGSFPSAIPGPGPTSAFGAGPSPSTFQPQPIPTAAAPIPQPVPVPEPKVLLPDSEGVLLLEQVINAVAGIYIYIYTASVYILLVYILLL